MTTAEPIRLVLAGNDAIVVACLEKLLAREADFEIVGRYGKGEDVLHALEELRPDILLLDLPPAPMGGLALLREMRRLKLTTPVIFVSGTLEEEEFLEAVRLGVRGIVPRDIQPSLLARCIRRVHGGGIWLGPGTTTANRTAATRGDAPRRQSGDLSPREIEIVRLVCAGLRNKQIAERLGLGEATIKTHLHHIYGKLQLRGRLQLGLYGRQRGLL